MKKYSYSVMDDAPYWTTIFYRADGFCEGYVMKRWNGRFWVKVYEYDAYSHTGKSW